MMPALLQARDKAGLNLLQLHVLVIVLWPICISVALSSGVNIPCISVPIAYVHKYRHTELGE